MHEAHSGKQLQLKNSRRSGGQYVQEKSRKIRLPYHCRPSCRDTPVRFVPTMSANYCFPPRLVGDPARAPWRRINSLALVNGCVMESVTTSSADLSENRELGPGRPDPSEVPIGEMGTPFTAGQTTPRCRPVSTPRLCQPACASTAVRGGTTRWPTACCSCISPKSRRGGRTCPSTVLA